VLLFDATYYLQFEPVIDNLNRFLRHATLRERLSQQETQQHKLSQSQFSDANTNFPVTTSSSGRLTHTKALLGTRTSTRPKSPLRKCRKINQKMP